MQMNTRYDRKAGASKPTSMDDVRVGGWAEVCVGEWTGDNEQRVFGYIVRIAGRRISLQIADEMVSPEKTGLADGQVIEVELEDIFGFEFSPFQIDLEAWSVQMEIERELINQHQEEFDAFCPPEYALSRWPMPDSSSPEERLAFSRDCMRVRREFVDQLIQSGGIVP
jgi:hypothetical protein